MSVLISVARGVSRRRYLRTHHLTHFHPLPAAPERNATQEAHRVGWGGLTRPKRRAHLARNQPLDRDRIDGLPCSYFPG
eukprot:4176140-Prymnesium_polylepis.2